MPDEPDDRNAEHIRTRAWNIERFEELGLPYIVAYELALERVDWHAVKRAIDGGASAEQVARIFI